MEKIIKKEIHGAELEIFIRADSMNFRIQFKLDTSCLDEGYSKSDELLSYVDLSKIGMKKGNQFWWCRLFSESCCKNASQSQRIINRKVDRIASEILLSIARRNARKMELESIA